MTKPVHEAEAEQVAEEKQTKKYEKNWFFLAILRWFQLILYIPELTNNGEKRQKNCEEKKSAKNLQNNALNSKPKVCMQIIYFTLF